MIPAAREHGAPGGRLWVRRQLPDPRPSALIVVLDPDGVAELADLETLGAEEKIIVAGWLELRRVYEERGRDRSPTGAPLLMHVISGFRSAAELPWDIERHASVVRMRWPLDGPLRELLREVPDDLSDRVLEATLKGGAPAALAAGYGVVLPGSSAQAELDAVARLVVHPDAGPALWRVAADLLQGSLARRVAEKEGDPSPFQEAWRDWVVHGSRSPHSVTFAGAGPALAGLFATGLLRPERATATELPNWASIGVAASPLSDRIQALLPARPAPWPPADLVGWFSVAAWWGELRAALALEAPIPAELMREASKCWQDLDQAFQTWLQDNLGPAMLLATARSPRTVDKIAGFLARRLRERTNRLLLLVLDGVGFAQWSILRSATSFNVLEATACLAMVPTLTSISRQAIFAGELPASFADTLLTTSKESALWNAAWANEGIPRRAVRYERIDGRSPEDVLPFGEERVFGLVVSAVDRMLHGSALLGDAQVANAVRLWAQHGFIDSLLKAATKEGFEIWVTSDHGNLEASPAGSAREGLAVEQAGTRVRLYPNRVLRDAARTDGIAWDPPGLPADAIAPLFARGNQGFHRVGPKVSHGGLSLDEVIVPLSRVTL